MRNVTDISFLVQSHIPFILFIGYYFCSNLFLNCVDYSYNSIHINILINLMIDCHSLTY